MDIYCNEMTLKVERQNAWAMIEGFRKKDEHFFVSIFTAHLRAKSIQRDFKQYPKLITLIKKPKPYYPLNEDIVNQPEFSKYRHKYRYIAVLDRIFHITNKNSTWNELCNNGIFDIWSPSAPYNSLIDQDTGLEKEDPMILLLRIFEIENGFNEIDIKFGAHTDHVKKQVQLHFLRPVIPQNRNDKFSQNFKGAYYFEDIIEKIQKSLEGSIVQEEKVNDTSLIPCG
jgi:hypothetical protein